MSLSKVDIPVTSDLTIKNKDPLYPRRLVETGMTSHLESDFLKELKNLDIWIPLLQAIRYVSIYAKTVMDLCVKNRRRKPKDPATIHVMGKLSKLMIDQPLLTKYNDPGNTAVTVYIYGKPINNTLIDLGVDMNVMTK